MKSPEKVLLDKNIKPTAVRLLVLNVFYQFEHALSLQDVENELPWSDKASIFRTLKTFEKKHLIHSIADGHKAVKYALCTEKADDNHIIHPHFHCTKCHKTYCLEPQKIQFNTIPENFSVSDYELVVKGICADCG
jgi:Fur family ferric uptake transcriptional regulator